MNNHRISVLCRSASLYRGLARLRHSGFGIALALRNNRLSEGELPKADPSVRG
jgi:hypothetical protein